METQTFNTGDGTASENMSHRNRVVAAEQEEVKSSLKHLFRQMSLMGFLEIVLFSHKKKL